MASKAYKVKFSKLLRGDDVELYLMAFKRIMTLYGVQAHRLGCGVCGL